MTDFYQADPGEQANRLRALAVAALAEWNIAPDPRVELIKHRENAVFSVVDQGQRYALRVHRAGYHSDAELESELSWIKAINSSELRTPQVINTTSGRQFARVSVRDVPEERQVDLLEWFEGTTIDTVEGGELGEADLEATFSRVGELMATTHNHSQNWERPPGFTRHAWDEEGILGEEPLWGRFWELALLTDEQRGRLERASAKARVDLGEFGKSPDRYGLIHADFLPENLLRSESGICLIDFDDAGFGWHLFDIATTLFFHLGEDHQGAVANALLTGYRAKRELPDEHLARLPLFFLLRGLTYLGWAHTRSETETAQQLAPMVVAGVDELARSYLEP